jgi:A/G-specific adenine glycosylase
MSANAATRLLQHYVDNFRRLPWRSPPGSTPPDPYRVWLSEVMLQQTTVATVRPRFLRFVERWPTIEALAAAEDSDVLQEWAGLGYYARARNLIACARVVAELGEFPEDELDLRKLPGVGAYTAAAIAAIAFGKHATPIDTNVERVVARLHGIADKVDVRATAETMTPQGHAGDFAQAMMDLGAAICRPQRPLCGACPLASDCRARALGTPEAFPAPKVRKARPQRYGVAWWIEREGCVWLVRRPAKGMLGGMAALPGPEWQDSAIDAPAIARVIHVFTHFALDMAVVVAVEPQGDGWWQPLDRLAEAGLPTLYRRAAEAVLSQRAALAA